MRWRLRRLWPLALGSAGLLVGAAAGVRPQETAPPQPGVASEDVERLISQLGDDEWQRREQAMRELFARGPEIVSWLERRLSDEPDPEIRRRLCYLLDNIVPPDRAVLVVRAAPELNLEPGTIITHVGSRRVRNQSELRQRLSEARGGAVLRVRGPEGPREVGPLEMQQLVELADYAAPRGQVLAQALRLYATGLAEQSYALLRSLPQPIPESELSEPLHARIAYTAGDGTGAMALLARHAESVRPSGADWDSPSFLDLRGPGKAPLHLEWALTTQAGPEYYATRNDPDLRVQRILLPAGRYVDALHLTVGYWWRRYRGALSADEEANRVAGNQLAVAAWMLHGLDLLSECCRLIEPRSVILRQSRRGTQKWVRCETDAWLPFFAGDARQALDGFGDDALDILLHPPSADDLRVLTRNPQAAARVAFFLYQFPDDPRLEKGLLGVSQHTHPALTDYVDWMLYALQEHNQAAVRRDLHALLPHIPDQRVLPYARAVALLEYVQSQPDAEVLRTARRRLAAAPAGEERDLWTALVDALLHLSESRALEARRALLPLRDRAEAAALWHTAAFLAEPPAAAAEHAALRRLLLAVPLGSTGQQWLILARDRRLLRFDTRAGLLTALERPTPTWFPNPRTWPWVGREQRSGRVWVYCRRRVLEIASGGAEELVRLNIRTADIPAFDRWVGPQFSALAAALDGAPVGGAENGEFLRAELKANGEFCADPDLPEIGMIEALPQAPRLVHVALRGGPHLLIDTATGRAWSSAWIADRLGPGASAAGGGRRPGLAFFAQALGEPAADGSPIVMLMSDQGLLRFELGAERLSRIALPGPTPHPSLIPESTPYERRDPRFFYCARTPEDGGQVYRLTLADGKVEEVDMINEALPAHYYDVRLRSGIRSAVNRRLQEAGLPELETFIEDAARTVARWAAQQEPQP